MKVVEKKWEKELHKIPYFWIFPTAGTEPIANLSDYSNFSITPSQVDRPKKIELRDNPSYTKKNHVYFDQMDKKKLVELSDNSSYTS